MRRPLTASRLIEALVTQGPYAELRIAAQVDSTNAVLLRRAATAADLSALLAEHQTAGRGRLHPAEAEPRPWFAPPRSSLIASVLFRPAQITNSDRGKHASQLGACPVEQTLAPTVLAMAFGLATVRALDLVLPAEATLKWPNDIMVGQLKVGGILAQLAPGGQIVIGLGLNVDQTKAELPPGAGALASLGADVDRNWLAIAVLAAVAGMYERWRRADTSLLSDIGQRMPILGCPIEARLPDGTVLVGTGRALAADGSLILLVDGREVLIQAADLSPVGNRQTRPLPEAAAGDEA